MKPRAKMDAMTLAAPNPMSVADFLTWESRQDHRFEFDGQNIVAMTGGTAAHADIQANIGTAMRNRMRGAPCKYFGSDLKIEVNGSIRYPDGFVVCSPVARSATVVTDPVVIFEVLSPSTSNIDRIVKNREYEATPSVRRYIILEQDRIAATVFERAANDWIGHILTENDVLAMPEIGVKIPLAEFYEGLDFTEQESATP